MDRMNRFSTDVQEYQPENVCSFWAAAGQVVGSILSSDQGGSTPTASNAGVMQGLNDPATLGENAIEKLKGGTSGINLNSLGVAYDALSGTYKPDAKAMAGQLTDIVTQSNDTVDKSKEAASTTAQNVKDTAATAGKDQSNAASIGQQLTERLINTDSEAGALYNALKSVIGK